MKNFAKLFFQRVVIVALCILLQLAVIYLLLTQFSGNARWFEIALKVLSWCAVIFILSDRSNPSFKIAWVIVIFALPVFGILLYLLFGGNRLSNRQREKMRAVDAYQRCNLQQDPNVYQRLAVAHPEGVAQTEYLLDIMGYPVYDGAGVYYYPSGELCFEAMLGALRRAQRTIYLEYFIIHEGYMWNKILRILKEKAANGLVVRVIYDDFGCIRTLPMGYAEKLERYGIECCVFNPFIPVLSARLNNRDHRKLLIVDNEVAFTGGINLSDEYINKKERFGHWKDCGIELRGDAVHSMTAMFLSMWNYINDSNERMPPIARARGDMHTFVQPFCDTPLDDEDVGRTVILNLVCRAQRIVRIMTPYLVLDEAVETALCTAAKSGIQVQVITPGIGDKWYVHMLTRGGYGPLLRAGVEVYEYTPGFIHSKVCAADGQCGVVGTVNLDYRSLYLHFENAVWLYGDAVEQLDADFNQTLPKCTRITLEAYESTPLPVRFFRAVLRIIAPMM